MKEIMSRTDDISPTEEISLSKWKGYQDYKYSGIHWYERIPNHWRTWKIAHAFMCIGSGTTPLSSHQEYYDGDIAWVNTSELRDGFINFTAKKISQKALQDLPTLRVYKAGTLLIALYGATIGRVGILRIDATTNQACCALSESSIFDTKFLFFFFLAYRKHLITLSYGGGQPNINQEIISSLRIPTPPFLEQRVIVTFLDRETSKLNNLIAKKERLIELLKEHRAAIINQAVTRGVDPDVAMKDSEFEWMGKIPSHWKVKRMKYVVSETLKYGANEAASLTDPSLPRYIRITDINDDGSLKEESFRSLPKEVAKPYLLKNGDILFARSGATVGKVFLYDDAWGDACYAGYLIRARINSSVVDPFFINYFVNTPAYQIWLSSVFIQATIQNVSAEKYANLPVPLPPLQEQKEIITFLDQETEKIDKLISTISGGIQKLKEYSSALISAAVTGKIDVRGEMGEISVEEEMDEDGA